MCVCVCICVLKGFSITLVPIKSNRSHKNIPSSFLNNIKKNAIKFLKNVSNIYHVEDIPITPYILINTLCMQIFSIYEIVKK